MVVVGGLSFLQRLDATGDRRSVATSNNTNNNNNHNELSMGKHSPSLS